MLRGRGRSCRHRALNRGIGFLVCLLLVGTGGCIEDSPGVNVGKKAEPARTIRKLPAACAPTNVTDRVLAFVHDYNAANPTTVSHFARVTADRSRPSALTRGFQWYADNGSIDKGGFITYYPNRRLSAYFERAFAAKDTMTLGEIYINNYSKRQDWASFGFVIERTRAGLRVGLAIGKGAVSCSMDRITLFNIGPDRDEETFSLCDDGDYKRYRSAKLCVRPGLT